MAFFPAISEGIRWRDAPSFSHVERRACWRFAWQRGGARRVRRRHRWHAFPWEAARLGRPMRLGKHIGDNLVRLRGPACWRRPRRRRAYARRERRHFVPRCLSSRRSADSMAASAVWYHAAAKSRVSRSIRARIKRVPFRRHIEPVPAPKSAPKTPIFRADRKAMSSGVSAKPGNRKDGTFGAVSRPISSPVIRFESLDDLFLRRFLAHFAQGSGWMRSV